MTSLDMKKESFSLHFIVHALTDFEIDFSILIRINSRVFSFLENGSRRAHDSITFIRSKWRLHSSGFSQVTTTRMSLQTGNLEVNDSLLQIIYHRARI